LQALFFGLQIAHFKVIPKMSFLVFHSYRHCPEIAKMNVVGLHLCWQREMAMLTSSRRYSKMG